MLKKEPRGPTSVTTPTLQRYKIIAYKVSELIIIFPCFDIFGCSFIVPLQCFRTHNYNCYCVLNEEEFEVFPDLFIHPFFCPF